MQIDCNRDIVLSNAFGYGISYPFGVGTVFASRICPVEVSGIRTRKFLAGIPMYVTIGIRPLLIGVGGTDPNLNVLTPYGVSIPKY